MIHTVQIDDSTQTGKLLLQKVLRSKSAVTIVKTAKQKKTENKIEAFTDEIILSKPNDFKSFSEFQQAFDSELSKRFVNI